MQFQKLMNRPFFSVALVIAGCFLGGALFGPPGLVLPENKPPEVKIRTPQDGGYFGWNALTRYAIEVSDAEDGLSKYEEIPSHKVFLEVAFLPEGSPRLTENKEVDPPGLALIKDSDCFNCHASKAKMIGPSLFEIANRYEKSPGAVKTMSKRIIEGSSGVWGPVAMSPHPGFSEKEAIQVATWILENGGDPHRSIYRGIEGTFRTVPQPASGAGGRYRLTATYTDKGLEGRPEMRRQGRHTILLRSR